MFTEEKLLEAANLFLELLERRLTVGVPTTEDSVRYTFFAALLRLGVEPDLMVLEHPVPEGGRGEIDTVILGGTKTPVAAIEFKYHRPPPSGWNQPKTQKAGAVFADICRLAATPWACQLYMVYVCDDEMAGYFSNIQNRLTGWFCAEVGTEFIIDQGFLARQPKSFSNELTPFGDACACRLLQGRSLPAKYHARVFAVRRVTPSTPPMAGVSDS